MGSKNLHRVHSAGALIFGVGAFLAAPSPLSAQTTDEPVTFAKHVAPILQRACQSCHRTGSIAPMSLLTYEEVRPWARSIKQRVAAREMPPWFVDRHVGVQGFKADKSLSDAEIELVLI